MTPPEPTEVFARVVAWQRRAGRHGLPWQGTRDPYRVWLSEIMLQQTQVATVLRYYERFVARFANVHALAAAPLDEVLAAWSGLGYYRRARLLHRCAQVVVQQHGGRFPCDFATLRTLPGIGDSTAAAIAAFCAGERVSILDGNVRRVLMRLWADDRDPAAVATQRDLWTRAQGLVPATATPADMAAYTQGLMDLGATVCTRLRPRCDACPLSDRCQAHRAGTPTAWPRPRARAPRRTERWWLLVLRRDDGACWLQRRASGGIWGGLWAPPVLTEPQGDQGLRAWLQRAGLTATWAPPQPHALTHRDLALHWVVVPWTDAAGEALAHVPGVQVDQGAWWSPAEALVLGLPAPVRGWLASAAVSRTSSSR
ncbi:MAG: A/G-specific adenine glycosylase [Tepidimonas ignava]|uniref:A/G-specific adenine glycosylase n=1 Tax=Tepidimonas ignava TaxID=114249 RepID=UPI00391A144D